MSVVTLSSGKPLRRTVKILAYAAIAKPTAKLGQSLGPLGLNMAAICKEFNEKTQHIRPDVPLRALLHVYLDKTYKLEVLGPPSSWMIKRAMGVKATSPAPGHEYLGIISIKAVYEIAKLKQSMEPDLQKMELESYCRVIPTQCIIGTCKAMGVQVVKETPPVVPKIIPFRRVGQK